MRSPSFAAKSGDIKFLSCPGRAAIAWKFLATSGTEWKTLSPTPPKWDKVKLSNRMLLGVYIAQYCITTEMEAEPQPSIVCAT